MSEFIENLQQHIEYIGMRLFDFVEQNHRIGPAPHRFSQVAAFFIAHIARGRTDEPRHRMLLHELGHVEPHHCVFRIKQEICQGFGQFGFANTRRPQKQKGTNGSFGIRQPCARSTNGVRDGRNSLALTDNAFLHNRLHLQQLLLLAFEHLGYRNTGPLRHNLRNLFFGHVVTQ